MPDANSANGIFVFINLKEFVMNQTPELELVDLGEAKELTKGWLLEPKSEDNTQFPTKPQMP